MNQPESLSAAAKFALDFAAEKLLDRKLLVLSGAGISTESGIPDYRGAGKEPRHPMTFDAFMGSAAARQRYWARSYFGWNRISQALPNAAHHALARAEQIGKLSNVITQNVDQLHQKAGSINVIDLHGRLDRVICMSCKLVIDRKDMDLQLEQLNPDVNRSTVVEFSPDGDAEVAVTEGFKVPDCLSCRGVLKPNVVFFGESVPPSTVEVAMKTVDQAQAMLVVGTSLSVNSGLRFVRRAAKAKIPIYIVNLGKTKADELAEVKIEAHASLVLGRLLNV
jgi:NAD-dependent SIR2 family protein deacetylase